jgi:hypothetical protein
MSPALRNLYQERNLTYVKVEAFVLSSSCWKYPVTVVYFTCVSPLRAAELVELGFSSLLPAVSVTAGLFSSWLPVTGGGASPIPMMIRIDVNNVRTNRNGLV